MSYNSYKMMKNKNRTYSVQGIAPREIVSWISEIEKILLGLNSCNCPGFLKPIHLVTIGLAVKKSEWGGLKLPNDLAGYASRMNLWDSINMQPPYQVNQYKPLGKFLPVQRFDQHKRDVQVAIDGLADIINKTLSTEYHSTLSNCLEELVNNFFDHARSTYELPCLIAAQSWPKGKLVQVAIADAGIGIRSSLNENTNLLYRLNNENACKLASTYGISSKLGNNHSGYGLALAKNLMEQANGSYILVSGNEIYSSIRGADTCQEIQGGWGGTILVLEWSLDSQLSSKLVYDSWPLPEGFNIDDFF